MSKKEIETMILHWISNYWEEFDADIIKSGIPVALERIQENFKASSSTRLYDGSKVNFSLYHTVSNSIFLYYLSNTIFKTWGGYEADIVYYLNKIMNANDWFYQIQLPVHFLAEHPIGSVLGKASYGDYLFIYQGTTIGGNRKEGKLFYPVLGNNVLLYTNSTVLGDTKIGNNVVISAGTYLLDENIPDNCIVFGRSPNIEIKMKSEQQMKDMTSHIWRW